jgi:hypothetical protein
MQRFEIVASPLAKPMASWHDKELLPVSVHGPLDTFSALFKSAVSPKRFDFSGYRAP